MTSPDQPTDCFVVMGYRTQRDYAGQRDLDLDRTYENLIRPAAALAGLTCSRGDEITTGKVIDRGLFVALLRAPVVVADISTANPNALYELGVRHALRPRSTIVIAEHGLRLPFDLSHLAVLRYEHLGTDIGVSEARRFTAVLGRALRAAVDDFEPDSPVYVHLPDLIAPVRPGTLSLVGPDDVEAPSLRDLLRAGERALRQDQPERAIPHFTRALAVDPTDPDLVRQVVRARLAAAGTGNAPGHLAAAVAVLIQALGGAPAEPTLLDLWADVQERLADLTGDLDAVDQAVRARERLAAITGSPADSLAYARVLDLQGERRPDRRELNRLLAADHRRRALGSGTGPAGRVGAPAGSERP